MHGFSNQEAEKRDDHDDDGEAPEIEMFTGRQVKTVPYLSCVRLLLCRL